MLSEEALAHASPFVGTPKLADWLSLLKPRVLVLVVYTGVIGLILAPGHLTLLQSVTAILCITGAAGACGAINMWYDRDIDTVMRRTRNRPIPAGRISPEGAIWFGIILAAISILVMGFVLNVTAALSLLFSVLFYVFIYTVWLKRRTPQNIVIGGAAGALPPVIGWAASTGRIDLTALVLFGIIFVWTPPHFWALSLWANSDYRAAGIPMLPVVSGARETRRQILLYTVLLVPLSTAPYFLGANGLPYLVASLLFGAVFLWRAWQVMTDEQDETGISLTNDKPAKLCFKYSVIYLFALFGALAVDHWMAGFLAGHAPL
ncbi:MAG TPA: heme o synthase [Rhodopila sp.]|nr:heme o synthase [Rhodopila sp.]